MFERFVPEPQSIQYSGGKVFGYRIRYLDKLGEELFAFFGFKIEGNSEFVGVVIVERPAKVNAPSIIFERIAAPENIPSTFSDRIFNSDDLCTE